MQNRARIDKINYLASLVSDTAKIDSYLDPLREFTATRNDLDAPLNPADAAIFDTIEANLKNYLVTEEPLRAFTEDTLKQRLYEHFEAPGHLKALRWQAMGFLTGTALVGGIVSLFSYANAPLRINTSFSAIIALLYLGASVWIAAALKNFSPALRSAYRTLTIGYVICALQLIAVALLKLAHGGTPPWHTFWPINLPLGVATAVIYEGTRRIAHAYHIQTVGLSVWVVPVTWVVGAVPLLVSGHGIQIDSINGTAPLITWFSAACMGWSAWNGYNVSRQASELYRPPVFILSHAAIISFVGYTILTFVPFMGSASRVNITNLTTLLFIAGTFITVRATYTFAKLGEY